MIIIYGTRGGSSETRLATPCGHCRQQALVQHDGYRYLHLMFIPTFPLGSERTIHCEACGNSYDAKGSAPIWTFAGSMLFVIGLLGFGAFEALKHFGVRPSFASVTSAASAPPANASSSPAVAASASPSPPPLPASPVAAPKASPATSARATASPAPAARPAKRKK